MQLPIWSWENRHKYPGVPQEPDKFVQAAISGTGPVVSRAGSTLRLPPAPDGRSQLAFLGQTAYKLADIQKAITGLADAGQRLLSTASLDSLQSVSMVTLGLSALTPLLLAAQFRHLNKRLNDLQQQIRKLSALLEDRYISELESGIELLESGVRQQNKGRIEGALQKCNDAAVFFGNRVQSAVAERQDRRGVLLLSRHLSVAICGTTRCFIALDEDAEARKMLGARTPALRRAARAVFQQTVARDPGRFMIPALTPDVSLESFVDLFRQAKHAGALDESDPVQRALAEQPSAAALFETLREKLFSYRRMWPFGPRPEVLRSELLDATACVEETNRVQSLADFLEESQRTGRRAIEGITLLDEEANRNANAGIALLDEKSKDRVSPYFVWGM